MSAKRKQRPGFYGRIYADLGTHEKWVGGFHRGHDYKPLSWPARGLWTALVSLAIRKESDGVFSAADIVAMGADAAWLEELVANRLVDVTGGRYALHDYSDHSMTRKEWKAKLKNGNERKDRLEQKKNAEGTVSEQGENKTRTRSGTRSALDLSLRSESEISEPPTVPAEPPPRPGTARRWTALAKRACGSVSEALAKRGASMPPRFENPDSREWSDLAKWAEGVERNRAELDGLTAEEAIDFAVAEWLDTDAPRHAYAPTWFSTETNKYFLAESIQARAKRREREVAA